MRFSTLVALAVVLFLFYCLDPGTFMQVWHLFSGIAVQGLSNLMQWLQGA